MVENPLKVTSEYVRTYVGLWGTAIGWTPKAMEQIRSLGLIRLDVLEVLRTGTATACEKESSDGAILLMVGVTCDDVALRITVWSDAGIPLLKVTNVQII
jgi:hypothetical protein